MCSRTVTPFPGGPRELSRLSTLTGIHIGKTIIPMAAIIPIVIFILMAVVLSKTTFGRQVILTGSNPKSAEHAGISVSRIYIIVYLLSGVFAGIAAMFIPMCIGGVNPDVGANLLMPMVAADHDRRDQPVRRLRQHGAGRLRHPVHHVPDERNDLPGLRLPTQQLAYGIVIVFTMTLLGYIERKRFRV